MGHRAPSRLDRAVTEPLFRGSLLGLALYPQWGGGLQVKAPRPPPWGWLVTAADLIWPPPAAPHACDSLRFPSPRLPWPSLLQARHTPYPHPHSPESVRIGAPLAALPWPRATPAAASSSSGQLSKPKLVATLLAGVPATLGSWRCWLPTVPMVARAAGRGRLREPLPATVPSPGLSPPALKQRSWAHRPQQGGSHVISVRKRLGQRPA